MNIYINTDKLTKLIEQYAFNHESVIECGSEYIYQDDDARTNAVDLVCDIFDTCIESF